MRDFEANGETCFRMLWLKFATSKVTLVRMKSSPEVGEKSCEGILVSWIRILVLNRIKLVYIFNSPQETSTRAPRCGPAKLDYFYTCVYVFVCALRQKDMTAAANLSFPLCIR